MGLHYSAYLIDPNVDDITQWAQHLLFILLANQLVIRHSSRSGTCAVGLNAKLWQKPTGAMSIVLQPHGM